MGGAAMITSCVPPDLIDKMLFKTIANSISNLDNYVARPGKDFTRDRKLDSTTLVCSILNMGGDTIREELRQNPCSKIRKEIGSVLGKHKMPMGNGIYVTSGGFCLQRQKLSYRLFEDAFKEFNRLTLSTSPSPACKGLQMLVVDGTDIPLPANAADADYYMDDNKSAAPYNQVHLDCFYSITQGTFVSASTRGKRKSDERRVAIELMEECPLKNVLLTGDRGYESYNFIAHAIEKGWFYLIRTKEGHSNGIVSALVLPDTPEFDMHINMTLINKQTKEAKALCKSFPNEYRYRSGANFDFFPDKTSRDDPMCTYQLSFRVVRIEVEPGTYETLVTNLPKDKYPPKLLKELYHMRWQIENAYRDLKYAEHVRDVHTKKAVCVLQEIYARLLHHNYVQLMVNYAEEIALRNDNLNYEYQAIFVAAVGTMRRHLNGIDPPVPLETQIWDDREPVRPGRKAVRKMHSQGPSYFTYRGSGC